jgi:hypothetical protein
LRLAAAVQRARDTLELRRTPHEAARQAALVAHYRRSITDASPEDAWAEGAHWEMEDAVSNALGVPSDAVATA